MIKVTQLKILTFEPKGVDSHWFSAFDFSLSSHALINDNLFSVATLASTASEDKRGKNFNVRIQKGT